MTSATLGRESRGILRHSRWDALLVASAAGQGVLLLMVPTVPVIALGLWWNSNAIAHNFIHRPFFRSRALNRLFALYLTLLLGVPQTLWRDRHLAHHAGRAWHLHLKGALLEEIVLVLSLWVFLFVLSPRFFPTVYAPAYLLGLALCYVHGHFEHRRGTISHYGRLYNFLFFNDGYHVEHHAHPRTHWRRLPEQLVVGASVSRWPAVVRWLDVFRLEGLERWVLRSAWLQGVVLKKHERALHRLLPNLPAIRRVGIVGGGLFPRTALLCRRLLPQAKLVIIDLNADNLQVARSLLPDAVDVINEPFDAARHGDFDLLVFPLAYVGDRAALYRQPPAPHVLIHDWIWHRHRPGVIVSVLFLKRLNLVTR
jgi:hypothetical protein